MSKRFCELLTGNTTDPFFWELTNKADKGNITDEEYFGAFVKHYGDMKVSNVVMTLMKEYGVHAEKKPSAVVAKKPERHEANSPQPQEGEGSSTPPLPNPSPKTVNKKTGSLIGTTNIKDLCSVCTGAPLLGVLLVLRDSDWFKGKDKDFIMDLTQKLEKGDMAAEDVFAQFFIKFGAGAIDGFNRIFDDINVVMAVAKEKAIKERPELAKLDWGDSEKVVEESPPIAKKEEKKEKKGKKQSK